MTKILTVVGARPQFIKAAVVSRALKSYSEVKEVMVHTGQHYDYNMSEVFFEELNIDPSDYNLGVGSGTHGSQTGKMMIGLEEVILNENPDSILIYGDTNSTLAAALVGTKLHVKVAHVEAGLRSFNKKMPEEVNRITADHISDYLFCPTDEAIKNLKAENITRGVYLSGDVMYDSVQFYAGKSSDILSRLSLEAGSYCLLTIHRPENTNVAERLCQIFSALANCGKELILPIHPRLRVFLEKYQIRPHTNIHLIDPVSYVDMIHLEKNAELILTDSGGVQKEAYFFQKPCITLRDETEWVETIQSGWNVLVGADKALILKAIEQVVKPEAHPDFYGAGDAGTKIAQVLANN